MLARMTRLRIVGRRQQLERVLDRLYRLRLLELEPSGSSEDLPAVPGEGEREERLNQLRRVRARVDRALSLAGVGAAAPRATAPANADAASLAAELDEVEPRAEALSARLDELRAEQAVLPRYVEPLRRLLPLVPELAELGEEELQTLRLETIALVLNTEDDRVVEMLREVLRELLGERFELVAARVDRDVVGCVIVVAHRDGDSVRELLGREQVRHLPLPSRYERLSFHGAVEAMEARLRELPDELRRTTTELDSLLSAFVGAWLSARDELGAEIDRLEAVEQLGATARTFVATGWTPTSELPLLREELERSADGALVVEELDGAPGKEPPVLMQNRRAARPFEFLVQLLDLPRAGSLDPTMLMALFLPLMVGVMVGDIGYGALLLALSLYVKHRFAARSAVVRDLARVFVAGSLWAIVFGFVFGEALGDVGKRLGLRALWFYRGGHDAVEPLLLFALALGAAHVVLGLVLGLWRSVQARRPGELLERAGSLLALGGVFALAGVAADRLPGGALTPAAAAVVLGLVFLIAPGGALGLMMGPLALIGTLGNVLSYLRLAAVGLASAYLAIVANQLAALGPIWMGVLIAALFHALNLALAAFSPMIQAIRLHYVEFFSKFYEGGGRRFQPFGERTAA